MDKQKIIGWYTHNGARRPIFENSSFVEKYKSAIANENFNNTNINNFISKLEKAKKSLDKLHAWRVTVYDKEHYKDVKLFTTKRGSTIGISKDGDIISVCKNQNDLVTGRDLLEKAVKNGGIKLDSYDGNYGFYRKCGFEPVSWTKFNEKFAPSDCPKGENEDIIFFKYTGNKLKDKDKIKQEYNNFKLNVKPLDYDSAFNLRDRSIKK